MIRDSRGGHNRKFVDENFFKKWSPEMAYILGFIYADGSLLNTNSSSRTSYIAFSNNDLQLLESIRKSLKSKHTIRSRLPHQIKVRGKEYTSKQSYVLRIGNKIMCNDLLELGIQHRKSKIMTFPMIPHLYLANFVRGYFDGDGCISWYYAKGRNFPTLRVLFSSGSYKFLEELSCTLRLALKITTAYINKNMEAFNLIYQGSKAVILLDFIYNHLDDSPYLNYKYKRYLDFKNNLMGPRVRQALEKFSC